MTDATATPVRRHVVPGIYNLRDTGGYRAAGGTTRWGKLFRSDALHRIDDTARARLAELGIAHVVDLRGEAELASAPSALGDLPITVHHLPVFDDAAPQTVALLGLVPVYDHIVDARGAALVRAIRVIAEADDDEAVLVHCTAGKDRTGLVVAFALLAAGVDVAEVVADYAATEENLRGEWADRALAAIRAAGHEPTPDVVELVTASPAPVLEALIRRVEADHGSVRDYLVAHGLTAAEIDRLAAVLIA